jgi:hypothetical protein
MDRRTDAFRQALLDDPQRPYVCLACGRRYETCPDLDAYNCSACGGKVGPAYRRDGSLWCARYEAKCHDGCDAETFRADGNVVCETCKRTYRDHPGCFATRYTEGDPERGYYVDRVLCDGRHVHL